MALLEETTSTLLLSDENLKGSSGFAIDIGKSNLIYI